MSLIRRAWERRSIWSFGGYGITDPRRIPRNSDLAIGSAGMPVTESSALQLTAVGACVSLIADSISTMPLAGFRRDGGTRYPLDPIPEIVGAPFAEYDNQDGLHQLVYSILMRGNSWAAVASTDRLGRPTSLEPVHPDTVEVRRDRDGRKTVKVNGERVRILDRSGIGDVLHIRGFTIPGLDVGLGPIDYARAMIGLALAQQEYAARFFSQNAMPGMTIQVPAEMSEEGMESLLAFWRKHHQGVMRAHEPGVLTGGATLKEMSVTPEQAQFLQSRRFQVNEVARLFRCPPHMIMDVEKSTSWGTGIEEQGIGFVVYTLTPWLVRFENAWSKMMRPGEYAKFNVAGLLRGDQKSRFEAYKLGRDAGFLTLDDILELEDRPPVGDQRGDLRLQPMNMRSLGEATLTELTAAIGQLVRSGYTPESSVAAVMSGDMSGLEHTGTIPVTVQLPESIGAGTQGGGSSDGS